MNHLRLKGRKALVTGGDRGIGRGIALALAQAGADVVVNYHSQEQEAKEVVHALQGLGVQSFAFQADVSQEEQVQALFTAALEQFGDLDIFINNSGAHAKAKIEQMTLEQWNQVIGVNLTGAFLCAREAVRAFKNRRSPSPARALGNILFISSVHDTIPWAEHANYVASKGGLKMFMQTLAQELAPQRIRVNSISPGAIRTSSNQEKMEDSKALNRLLKLIPYQRIGEPEDIGRAVVWMVSDEADYVTGATLYVDGGMMLYPSAATEN